MGLEMPLHSLRSVMFLLVSCLGGMRGYEVVWTDLGALNYDLDYCKSLNEVRSGLASGGAIQGKRRSS